MGAQPPIDWLVTGGVTGVLAFMLLCLMKGWGIVTAGRYQDMREDRDAWKTAYQQEHAARLEADKIAAAAIRTGEVTNRLLGQIKDRQSAAPYRRDLPLTDRGDQE